MPRPSAQVRSAGLRKWWDDCLHREKTTLHPSTTSFLRGAQRKSVCQCVDRLLHPPQVLIREPWAPHTGSLHLTGHPGHAGHVAKTSAVGSAGLRPEPGAQLPVSSKQVAPFTPQSLPYARDRVPLTHPQQAHCSAAWHCVPSCFKFQLNGENTELG